MAALPSAVIPALRTPQLKAQHAAQISAVKANLEEAEDKHYAAIESIQEKASAELEKMRGQVRQAKVSELRVRRQLVQLQQHQKRMMQAEQQQQPQQQTEGEHASRPSSTTQEQAVLTSAGGHSWHRRSPPMLRARTLGPGPSGWMNASFRRAPTYDADATELKQHGELARQLKKRGFKGRHRLLKNITKHVFIGGNHSAHARLILSTRS